MGQMTRRNSSAGNPSSERGSRLGRGSVARTGALLLAALTSAIAACATPPSDLLTAAPSAGAADRPEEPSDPSGGGVPDPGGACGIEQARAYFDKNVAPLIDNGAGETCARCHSSAYGDATSPHFLGSTQAEYYDRLIGNTLYVNASPADSLFLTRGLHTGPAWDAETQAPVVKAWLDLEAQARFIGCDDGSGSGGEPAGPTFEELALQFISCMTLDDWIATGMDRVATQQTLQDGPCFKCHATGYGDNPMTNPGDANNPNLASIEDGFKAMLLPRTIKTLIRLKVNETTGKAEGLEQAYRWRDKSSTQIPPHKYLLQANHVAAMDEWFAITMEKCFTD